MQKNSIVDVEDLLKATDRIYNSVYENPTLNNQQMKDIDQFVLNNTNQLCSNIIKKINLELL